MPGMYLYIQSAAAAAAGAALCWYTAVGDAADVAVRHRVPVPDGQKSCWFIESDSIQCYFRSLHSNTINI